MLCLSLLFYYYVKMRKFTKNYKDYMWLYGSCTITNSCSAIVSWQATHRHTTYTICGIVNWNNRGSKDHKKALRLIEESKKIKWY